MPRSAFANEASLVSAPSDTSTTPATGRPASSSRAPSSAGPSRVCDPPNVRSFADSSRPAVDENRNTRTRKRSDSALSNALSGAPNCCLTNSPRGMPDQSGICMLRESSRSTATTFCCGTAALTMSVGRNRQKSTSGKRRHAQRGEDDPVAKPPLRAHAAVGDHGHHHHRAG